MWSKCLKIVVAGITVYLIVCFSVFKKKKNGTCLGVMWLRLSTSTAGAWVQSLDGELRFPMLKAMAKNEKNENSVGGFCPVAIQREL